MNYNSVQEILSAGTTNMTVLRNNTKQDDGTDQITGVSWFTYNGITASTIYASGNSFIGFDSSSEHLKVNRRDGALYSLYREEGTLYNYVKFLKIRWSGYSQYSQTDSSYCVEYDVILWDTGDISLHMISIPTSYNDGTYSLISSSTYTYTVSSSNPDVTFIKTDSGFTVSNNIIGLKPPSRYLIRSGSTYYTINNNSLSMIDTIELTSNVFQDFGTEEIPELLLLASLTNPEIIYWTDVNNYSLNNGLVVKGIPPLPQVVYSDTVDMTNHTGIEKVECAASDDVLFAISIDDGQTWKYYNNGVLNVATDSEGMNVDVLNSFTSEMWEGTLSSSTSFKVRCVLPTATSNVGEIYIKYN